MSHIDESRMHEYLDALERGPFFGDNVAPRQEPMALHPLESLSTARREAGRWEALERHLAECAECRERLEEVRVVRQRAAGLLRDAAPAQISMPLFAEIETRHHARTRRAPRRMVTMNRLAAVGWAATLVLAVGIGWLARGSFEFRQTQELAPIATRVSEPTAELDVVGTSDETAPTSVTESVRAEPATAGGRGTAGPGGVAEGQVAATPPPEIPADTRARRLAEEEAAEREQLAKAAPTEPPTRPVAVDAAFEQEARRDAPAAGLAAQVADADVVSRQLNRAAVEASWRPATRSEAAAHLGDSVRTVAGLTIDSIAVGEINGSPAARIVQALPSGQSVEIVQWRSDDPDAPLWRTEVFADRVAAEVTPTPPTTVVLRDGYVLILRAPIEADSLEALAARIR
ncbi:MAG: hypothetical protein OER90_07635 [Gemmatimonadota bacterium]|nr:hypothetical protein [Gemmatimonadota bacterium]